MFATIVKHTIYFCKKDEIVKARKKIIYRYSRLNANIDHSENVPSISELLNLELNVAHNNKEKTIDIICTYFKQLYSSLL